MVYKWDNKDIIAEPVTAWRAWRFGVANPISLCYFTPWEVGALKFKCQHYTHEIPSLKCACGFWGVKDKDVLRRTLVNYHYSLVGEVELWGHIIEGDRGYRAEYARIKSIYTTDPIKYKYLVRRNYPIHLEVSLWKLETLSESLKLQHR